MSERRTAIVIPAYNEAATIRDLAERCLAQLPEVIVVDDGSSDATTEQLEGLPLRLLRNERNNGKAFSLKRGMQLALERGAEQVITLDGDGQHSPEDIPLLLAAAAEHPNQPIIAARLKELHRAPRARLFANRFADFWVSWAAGHWVHDSQSGFRLYPAELLRRVDLPVDADHGFVFESEILIEAGRLGYRCHPVAIASVYREGARPSHFRPVADIALIVRMIAWKLITRGLYLGGLWRALRSR